jgi:hypothetical protein
MSPLTAAAAAVQLLNNTLSALKAVRERAQSSKDADLKAHISTLYDSVLSLKEAVMLVTDENSELRRRIVQQEQKPPQPELRQVGAVNYYFAGDKGPYCQPCYDGKQRLVALTPPEDWSGGVRRRCVICKEYFYEKPMDEGPAFGTVNGPNGWMGR